MVPCHFNWKRQSSDDSKSCSLQGKTLLSWNFEWAGCTGNREVEWCWCFVGSSGLTSYHQTQQVQTVFHKPFVSQSSHGSLFHSWPTFSFAFGIHVGNSNSAASTNSNSNSTWCPMESVKKWSSQFLTSRQNVDAASSVWKPLIRPSSGNLSSPRRLCNKQHHFWTNTQTNNTSQIDICMKGATWAKSFKVRSRSLYKSAHSLHIFKTWVMYFLHISWIYLNQEFPCVTDLKCAAQVQT